MTGSDIDYLRATIDHLIVTQRLLLACTSVTEQGMQTPLDSPTNIQPSDLRMHITDDDDIIELATDMRLDEIKRDVRAKEYTWAGLREQYPPGQSGFAPLSVNANTLADIDNEDEVCSQAAAMAAYGIDLLKPALSSSQIDRMRVQKVVDLLAALCGMLVVARDKHRESAANVLIPAQDIGEDMESESADIASGQIAEVAHTQESSRCTKQRHQGFKIRGSSSSMRSHPYRRDCPRSASIVALDSRLDDTLEVASTTNQSRVQQPAKMPVGLSRVAIYRKASLHQGQQPESPNAALQTRPSRARSRTYGRAWKCWVDWCLERGISPVERSEEDLASCLSQCSTSERWKGVIQKAVEETWAISRA